MKNVLIIGGAGFVGSNLVKNILKDSPSTHITVIDNFLSSEKENIPISLSQLELIKGSITDDAILNQIKDKFDYIFHLATYHGNQSSIANPLIDHENNTLTTLKLFEKIKGFKKTKKVIYSSAGCCVAKKTYEKASPTTEEAPIEINPDSPYSISKIIGEFYSAYYYKQHQTPIVRARFQNVYGPGEILGAGQWRGTYATVWRNVIPIFIYRALQNHSLSLDNHGKTTRDFIYVDDICQGLLACAKKGKPGDVYNLGSGKEVSIHRLAKTINELTGSKAPIIYLPKRKWDNSGKRFASTKKAEKELDVKFNTSIEDGLKNTIEWTKFNIELINKNIFKHSENMMSVGAPLDAFK